MKVSFELSANDIRYFRERLEKVKRSGTARAEHRVIHGATALVAEAIATEPPEFVRERIVKLELLIQMLRDQEWRLEGKDRGRILDALAYFVDPDDLIPDKIPGIGFLDDAIMVELIELELRHEIEAYQDFCEYRRRRPKTEDETKLEARRDALQSRMRRRRRRERDSRSSGNRSSRPSLRLW